MTAGSQQVTAAAPLSIATAVAPIPRKARVRIPSVATGGQAPFTWKRIKRALPKGLKLTSSGIVKGKAKKRASKRIKVRVTDASGARSTGWIRVRVR